MRGDSGRRRREQHRQIEQSLGRGGRHAGGAGAGGGVDPSHDRPGEGRLTRMLPEGGGQVVGGGNRGRGRGGDRPTGSMSAPVGQFAHYGHPAIASRTAVMIGICHHFVVGVSIVIISIGSHRRNVVGAVRGELN